MMIFSIRKRLPMQETKFYTTIKTQRPSENKGCIIQPNFGTLELWEVLTWLSEGFWPAPHRCSLLGLLFCIVQVLFQARKDHVTYWWFFDIISWCHLWESLICKPYYLIPDKKLHGTYLFDGNHYQQSEQWTVTHYLGEASPNPHISSGTPHQIESRPKRAVMPEECGSRHSARGQRRY